MSTTDNQAGRPTKPCGAPGCTELIVRRTKTSAAAWGKVRYCGRRCTGIAASARHAERPGPTDSRPCGYSGCDQTITRRRGESPAKWRGHLFCSKRCVIRNNAERSRKPESDQTKPCELHTCDTAIRRKRTHSDAAWAKIRFCSTEHAAAARRNTTRPQRKSSPATKPPLAKKLPAEPVPPQPVAVPARPVWRPAGFTLRSANEYHLTHADEEEMSA